MALQFAICPQCGESHAVRADGGMSIHQTETGVRCAPSPAPAPRLHPHREPRPETYIDPELQAAYDEAARRKKPSQRDTDPGLDRRIYAVNGARPVRGGLPTLGRGRR